MTVLTSIWRKSKEVVQSYLYLKPGHIGSGLLVCIFLASCTSWPDTSERVISVSKDRQEIPEGLTRDYLKDYLNIGRHRYLELVSFGANQCLPGQMDYVTASLSLIGHEIDGNLLFDARRNLIELFEMLDDVRGLVENHKPSDACYKNYVAMVQNEQKKWYPERKLVMPELSDWTESVEVEALMRGK